MSGLRMSTVVLVATGSGFLFLFSLGLLVVANVQSRALVASYLTMLGSLIFFVLSILYDLLPISSSSDATAVVTYFPSIHRLQADYYVPSSDTRIFVENAINDHVDINAEINRSGLDVVARNFVVASTLGFFASEMGWWARVRSDNDGATTAVNRSYGPDAKQISVAQAEGMLRNSGNVFSDFGRQIGTIYAPPYSRMSVGKNGLHIRNDCFSLSIDVDRPIGHDRLGDGSMRLSLPLTISYKIARLHSQAADVDRYKNWLGQGSDKFQNWFAVTN